ncbi:DNA-directed RNA polymerase subunit alpha [Candidatus Microgenomates bacterium]|nr:DNA-directed RNA polymerase subunit alpha [Candidatus Microgenomates bacterium]
MISLQPNFEIKEEKDNNYSKFVITPLSNGYGNTLGTALRRVLLTSLPGAAITTVRISGVKHQFSTLKGMKEDVLDFLLNLKKVRISVTDDKPVKLTLSAKEGKVTAGDIQTPGGVSIANPDLVLANLSKGAKLEVEMDVETGVGYMPAEERTTEKVGVIALDASFSPVQRVNYKVEETRVGRLTNYDKLTLEVWTDGTVSAKDVIVSASQILVSYFNQIISPAEVADAKVESAPSQNDFGAIGKLSLEEVGVPTRVANALIKAGFDTVEKLANAPKEELLKVRNLGDKSLKVVKAALSEKGVELTNA